MEDGPRTPDSSEGLSASTSDIKAFSTKKRWLNMNEQDNTPIEADGETEAMPPKKRLMLLMKEQEMKKKKVSLTDYYKKRIEDVNSHSLNLNTNTGIQSVTKVDNSEFEESLCNTQNTNLKPVVTYTTETSITEDNFSDIIDFDYDSFAPATTTALDSISASPKKTISNMYDEFLFPEDEFDIMNETEPEYQYPFEQNNVDIHDLDGISDAKELELSQRSIKEAKRIEREKAKLKERHHHKSRSLDQHKAIKEKLKREHEQRKHERIKRELERQKKKEVASIDHNQKMNSASWETVEKNLDKKAQDSTNLLHQLSMEDLKKRQKMLAKALVKVEQHKNRASKDSKIKLEHHKSRSDKHANDFEAFAERQIRKMKEHEKLKKLAALKHKSSEVIHYQNTSKADNGSNIKHRHISKTEVHKHRHVSSEHSRFHHKSKEKLRHRSKDEIHHSKTGRKASSVVSSDLRQDLERREGEKVHRAESFLYGDDGTPAVPFSNPYIESVLGENSRSSTKKAPAPVAVVRPQLTNALTNIADLMKQVQRLQNDSSMFNLPSADLSLNLQKPAASFVSQDSLPLPSQSQFPLPPDDAPVIPSPPPEKPRGFIGVMGYETNKM